MRYGERVKVQILQCLLVRNRIANVHSGLSCLLLRAVANPTKPFVGCCRPFAAAKKRSVVFKVFVGSLDFLLLFYQEKRR